MSPTFLDQIHRDAEIDSANIRLYFLSRDRSVLGLLAILVLALSAGLAWLVQAPPRGKAIERPPLEELATILKSPQPVADRAFELILKTSRSLPKTIETDLLSSSLPPGSKLIATALVASLQQGEEPNARLFILAHQPQPEAAANEMIAELFARRGEMERAREYYLRELKVRPEPRIRARLISVLARRGELAALSVLANDSAFAPLISSSLSLKLALHQGDWIAAAKALTVVEAEAIHPASLILALVAGAAWFVIAVQAGQARGWFSYRTILPLLALLAGCVASWPAHFVAAWQDQVLGLRETGEFLADLAFYVGNVAPREELIKLAFILPFLPGLVIRRSPIETLVICGCVGLGFAIEGNLQTYQHAGPAEAFGRLLTANFFHFATTGLLGLAFCQFLFAPRKKIVGLLGTLLGVILAHGVYDAFMSISGVRLFAAASMMSFFIVSQVVFHGLRTWRDPTTDQLFLAATLVISLTILAGATLVCAAMEIGFYDALNAMAANTIGLAVVVVVFFRQLGKKLSKVVDEFPLAQNS